MKPYYNENGITIYNADCQEVLPQFDTGYFDLCLTDFPYAVNVDYDGYVDNEENLVELIGNTMPHILRSSKVSLITCGTRNVQLYPRVSWLLGWYNSAGAGRGPWGFPCHQPILVYGKDPYLKHHLGCYPDAFFNNEMSPKSIHPCPKPIGLWTWIMLRGSPFQTDLIMDPMMGSGTTLLVAKYSGRRAVGIEQSKAYCDEAIAKLESKDPLFTDVPISLKRKSVGLPQMRMEL